MVLTCTMLIYLLLMQYHVDLSNSLLHLPVSFSRTPLTVRSCKRPAHSIRVAHLHSFAEESNAVDYIPQQKRVRKGAEPEFAIANDSTVETPMQRFLVFSHFLITAALLANAWSSFSLAASPVSWIYASVSVALSVVLGDIGTGIFHWSVDNYGSLRTPVFGAVCAAFQGHHLTPWTITFRSFVNNVYKIALGTIPALLLVGAVPMNPFARLFFTLFINWWMISQELHKYSHMKPEAIPPIVRFLQDQGVILSRREHGQHHSSPFEGHYCILTGRANRWLDDSHFFRRIEKIVFHIPR
eukprot:gene25696-34272_t